MSEEDTGAPHFATGAEVEALLDKYARDRVGAHTRMQCKVCWYVYNPDEGCPEEAIDPGTPFLDLPDDFVCPDCGHPKTAFLPLDDDQADPSDPSGPAQGWSDRCMAKFLRSLLAQRIVKPSFGGGRQSRPTPAMMKRIGCTIPPAKASV